MLPPHLLGIVSVMKLFILYTCALTLESQNIYCEISLKSSLH